MSDTNAPHVKPEPDPYTFMAGIPNTITFDPDASMLSKHVYTVLNAKAGSRRWYRCTAKQLAVLCGLSEASYKTVKRATDYLVTIRAISVTKSHSAETGYNLANTYNILDWHGIQNSQTEAIQAGQPARLDTETVESRNARRAVEPEPDGLHSPLLRVAQPALPSVPSAQPSKLLNYYPDSDESRARVNGTSARIHLLMGEVRSNFNPNHKGSLEEQADSVIYDALYTGMTDKVLRNGWNNNQWRVFLSGIASADAWAHVDACSGAVSPGDAVADAVRLSKPSEPVGDPWQAAWPSVASVGRTRLVGA